MILIVLILLSQAAALYVIGGVNGWWPWWQRLPRPDHPWIVAALFAWAIVLAMVAEHAK